MATGPRYVVKFRRRRECKTDYKKRLNLLKSELPRFVVRLSNKYITCQFVKYETDGDKTLVSVSSKKLADFGWKYSGKNIVAAYLSGYLAGKLASEKKVKNAVFDIGLQSCKNSKIFAALKGAIDAGIEIPHGDERLPAEERLSGEHLSEQIQKAFKMVKEKIGGAKLSSKLSNKTTAKKSPKVSKK